MQARAGDEDQGSDGDERRRDDFDNGPRAPQFSEYLLHSLA